VSNRRAAHKKNCNEERHYQFFCLFYGIFNFVEITTIAETVRSDIDDALQMILLKQHQTKKWFVVVANKYHYKGSFIPSPES